MRVPRRDVVRLGLAAAVGGASVLGVQQVMGRRDEPFYGGPGSLLPPDPDVAALADDGRLVWQVRTRTKAMALTFDDGPHPDWTPKVLDALKGADVPATFFLRGDNVAEHARIHDRSAGQHEFGNHTYSHTDLSRASFTQARDEIARCTDTMLTAYGRRPTLFRPPYGHASSAALLAAGAAGLTTVLWGARFREVNFHDRPDGVVADAVAQVRPGTIFLGHDTGTPERIISIDRLPRVVATLKDAGWTFHTVSGLMALATPAG